jgi:hypothetical protein
MSSEQRRIWKDAVVVGPMNYPGMKKQTEALCQNTATQVGTGHVTDIYTQRYCYRLCPLADGRIAVVCGLGSSGSAVAYFFSGLATFKNGVFLDVTA